MSEAHQLELARHDRRVSSIKRLYVVVRILGGLVPRRLERCLQALHVVERCAASREILRHLWSMRRIESLMRRLHATVERKRLLGVRLRLAHLLTSHLLGSKKVGNLRGIARSDEE